MLLVINFKQGNCGNNVSIYIILIAGKVKGIL